jgi:hypothetical protein
VKLELSSRPEEHHVVNAAPYTETSADKISEIIPSNPWNSSTSTKLAVHKGGSVATADGNVIDSVLLVTVLSVGLILCLIVSYSSCLTFKLVMKYYDPNAKEQDSNVKTDLKFGMRMWTEFFWLIMWSSCSSYLTFRIIERVRSSMSR